MQRRTLRLNLDKKENPEISLRVVQVKQNDKKDFLFYTKLP